MSGVVLAGPGFVGSTSGPRPTSRGPPITGTVRGAPVPTSGEADFLLVSTLGVGNGGAPSFPESSFELVSFKEDRDPREIDFL